MTGLEAKLVLAVVGLMVTVAMLHRPPRVLVPLGLLLAAAGVVRIAMLIVMHGMLGAAWPSDVIGYFHHAERVLAGEVPNQGFETPYSFGFTYLLAAAVAVWRSPLAILVLFQIAELFGLYLLLRALPLARTAWSPQRVALLWLCHPLVLIVLTFGGQDEALLILAVGVAAWCLRHASAKGHGIAAALVLMFTKPLAGWLLWPWLVVIPQRSRALAGFAVVTAAIVAAALAMGSRVVGMGFSFDGSNTHDLINFTTTGNIWFLLDLLLPGIALSIGPTLLCAAGMMLAAAWLWHVRARHDRLELLLLGTALLVMVMQVTYRMTFAMYLVVALPGLLVVMRRAGDSAGAWLWLTGWSTLAAIDPSLLPLLTTQRDTLGELAFMGCVAYQGVLVGGHIAMLGVLVRSLAMGSPMPLTAAARRWAPDASPAHAQALASRYHASP
jgi:hypothetical protein